MARNLNRRDMIRGTVCGLGMVQLPHMAWAEITDMDAAIKDMFGDTPINQGRVSLTIPPLSENGYSVSLDVEADSPMTPDEYVKRIAIFSERNPIPLIAEYHFTPHSGIAQLSSKIRFGGTQTVHAIAEMSDGSLWSTSAKTFVTLAACVVL